MDANILAVITTVLGLAFALPGAVLSVIVLRDRISRQHKGNKGYGKDSFLRQPQRPLKQ